MYDLGSDFFAILDKKSPAVVNLDDRAEVFIGTL